ncbi:4-hydroxy-3-methylbut-2-en-1-yl diphosphate synthase [Clostridium sp. DL-VIII]|uniref:flavodoxin-dependent (E)-4-hydroxy-3-methylbut-2-enyl-diphosphate synthase n=1 Tax=Clostridium sp. DL-VIII TaxID=641107 RepID=UPI00023AFD5B|nr:flavodoxin-dependent (E)-4-hydroxy-3-methylbut-2-enyl-diphosphate synthase [Clostridium sp. DL-VIII]EHI98978.1 4-hydroxy-3-methylbut-2-en-1-yl diphosphate synthase [Clostridium sp. DL-VIII]
MKRNITRKIKVGNISIGGDSKISVQSMTNTDTRNINATVKQILSLEKAGCDIVRCAVPDIEAAEALKTIVNQINIPLIADIHFDYKLALEAINNGVAALRINPGNIGGIDRIKKVADAANSKAIPIRIGVNSGSLENDLLEKYNEVCPEALVESALRHVKILEDLNFYDICISIKSSDVNDTIKCNRILSRKVNYPIHLGITEPGTLWNGTIKSSIGIGTLLSDGIGDTIRVSLTSNVLDEVKVGRDILKSLGYINTGIDFISCPTCGRTQIDLIKIAKEVERRLAYCEKNIKVAIMGCLVNGPGEAREADIGIAGGKGEGIIFKKGKIIKKIKEDKLIDEFINEINKL